MKVSIRMNTWLRPSGKEVVRFDLEVFLRHAKEAGYDGVDLFGGETILGPPGKVRRLVAAYGLEISAYSTHITYNPYPPNVKQYRIDMRYGKALGIQHLMSTGGFNYYSRRNQYPSDYDLFAKNLGTAMKCAARFGQELAYYPHAGAIVETAAETQLLVDRLPELKLCPDIAQLEAAGDDAVRFIRKFKSRIIYAYFSDFDIPRNRFTELGNGHSRLSVSSCLHALKVIGYDGWVAVSLGTTMRTPLASAKISRRYLRGCGV